MSDEFQMTNYSDLPSIDFLPKDIHQYVFINEKPEDLNEILSRILIHLIKHHGFNDYDPQCLDILRTVLIDFYHDLLIRLKEYSEMIGSPMTFQDAFERILDEVLSINLVELSHSMKSM